MKNENKKFNKILLVLSILVFAVVFFVATRNDTLVSENNNPSTADTAVLGNKEDLISFSVVPGSTVSGVLSIDGSVKGGYFFEGNILVNILDVNKNVLKNSYANAKTDWMTAEPVEFGSTLDFTNLSKGPAYIEIHNDNASGLSENDKNILIPIIIN